jgi:hypothetical protein
MTYRHGHHMNKKFVAYATAAVLIGFAVMMLPLALEATYPTSQLYPQGYTDIYPDGRYAGEQRDPLDNAYGLTSQPSTTSSSLILLIGLIIAFTAYILVKKTINPPPAFSNWYKPF